VLQYLAALLLLNTTAPQAFIILANLLHRPLPTAFLTPATPPTTSSGRANPTPNDSALSASDAAARAARAPTHAAVLAAVAAQRPSLHTHLVSLAGEPAGAGALLDAVVRALVGGPLAGLEAASRVVDAWAFEGDGVLVGAAAAVLVSLEARLYGALEDVRAVLAGETDGGRPPRWDLGPTDEFVRLVRVMVDEAKGAD